MVSTGTKRCWPTGACKMPTTGTTITGKGAARCTPRAPQCPPRAPRATGALQDAHHGHWACSPWHHAMPAHYGLLTMLLACTSTYSLHAPQLSTCSYSLHYRYLSTGSTGTRAYSLHAPQDALSIQCDIISLRAGPWSVHCVPDRPCLARPRERER